MTKEKGHRDLMRTVRAAPGATTRNLTGLQTHLNFLVRYNWPGTTRPSAMAVRVEADILDYVKQILEIRRRARAENWHTYLEAEHSLLRASQGKLPAAIRLRASYCYRTSPRVLLAEMLYGDTYADLPHTILARYKEATGGGPADFLERLNEDEQSTWLSRLGSP